MGTIFFLILVGCYLGYCFRDDLYYGECVLIGGSIGALIGLILSFTGGVYCEQDTYIENEEEIILLVDNMTTQVVNFKTRQQGL